MSDSDEKKTFRRKGKSSAGDDGEKKDISPPPINLPVPDEFNTSMTDASVKNADARARAKAEKKRKKQKRRGHPTDSYEPINKSGKGCKGCLGCGGLLLVLGLIVIIGVPLYLASWAVKPYKDAGYDVVSVEKGSVEIIEVTEAPDIETLYLVPGVKYTAELTPKKIVFVGSDVTISGVFEDKVTFKGGKLTIKEGTVFKGDLEVYAVQMLDEGSTCEGELTGSVMSQK